VSEPFGPNVAEECRVWATSFALDPPLVESAFAGYLAMLSDAGDLDLADVELARGLAKLRRDIQTIIADGDGVPIHAELLDDMVGRLDRSLDRTALLESAGLTEGLGGLRARLTAARALVAAVRAALARRGRRGR